MNPKLWAVGPTVFKTPSDAPHRSPTTQYGHDAPLLHRVFVCEIGGIGEPNAGEFLIETPCGYKGWVRTLNKNPDKVPTCEACLNGKPSMWVQMFPPGAVAAPQGEASYG